MTLESFPCALVYRANERFEEGGIVYRRIPSLGIPRGAALSFQVVGGGGGREFHYHSLPGVENLIHR